MSISHTRTLTEDERFILETALDYFWDKRLEFSDYEISFSDYESLLDKLKPILQRK